MTLDGFVSGDPKGWTMNPDPTGPWSTVKDGKGQVAGWTCEIERLSGYVLPDDGKGFVAYKGTRYSCLCLGRKATLIEAKASVESAIVMQISRPRRTPRRRHLESA